MPEQSDGSVVDKIIEALHDLPPSDDFYICRLCPQQCRVRKQHFRDKSQPEGSLSDGYLDINADEPIRFSDEGHIDL